MILIEKKNNLLLVLKELKKISEESDIFLKIEPLNTLVDHKGYFLKYSSEGFNLVEEVNSKNIKVLYDIYHLQIMQGNIISDIEKNFDLIGHFHIADVPGRHEPGTAEINYKNIYKKIRDLGFSGFITIVSGLILYCFIMWGYIDATSKETTHS